MYFLFKNILKCLELKYTREIVLLRRIELRTKNQNDDAVYEGTGTGDVKRSVAFQWPCITCCLNANKTMLPLLFNMNGNYILVLTHHTYTVLTLWILLFLFVVTTNALFFMTVWTSQHFGTLLFYECQWLYTDVWMYVE